MGILGQNLRFAVRQLWRTPAFTGTVILTLALSIGANTAIFSVVNALLLKCLPYSHPERMGTICTRVTGPIGSDERHHLNGEQWELLRDNVPSLISALSATATSGVNLQADSRVQYLHAGRISAHYFDVLAIHPIIGRNFSDTEDRPHGPKTALLSYRLWRIIFGSDPTISGKNILLKGEPYTVVGVLPEGATIPLDADLYTALQASRDGEGGGTNFDVITRLRDGANWQQADSEINRAWSLRTVRYELQDNPGAQVTYYSVPLQKGETATLRPQVLALMLAAGIILLIACANLAGLTLVRMLRRTSEIATRLALGASHWQIQKQFWVETLLLAFVGGIAGRVAPASARTLPACGRRRPRWPRADIYGSHVPGHECAVWHAPCSYGATIRLAFRCLESRRDWGRPIALAPDVDCQRGCADRGVAGCFRSPHSHSRPPTNLAIRIRLDRSNDRESIPGRCTFP